MSRRDGATQRLVAALDLGSTGVKVLITDEHGTELLVRQCPTPWSDGPGGTTSMHADQLLETLAAMLRGTADDLRQMLEVKGADVEVIAVSGMGETGVLVDRDGVAAAPAFAWFDPRGQHQVDALPSHLSNQFAGRTGLPLGAQVSVAKLLYLRDNGLTLRGLRWLNLPEYVAAALGARSVSEYSLASRTGLLDQESGKPWTAMLEYLDVDDDFLPPLVEAGTNLGAASAGWLPPAFAGAQVTVAGHDHLVSATAGGDIPVDRYHVSMGTAEVLLRVLDDPVPFEAREQLAAHLINSVRHVVPGRHVLVAGVKTGLLMRRALQLCGIHDRAGRDQLDRDTLALPLGGLLAADAIEVRGARNDDGVLALTVRADGANPAELFGAVLRHGNDEIRHLVDAMDQVLPPARSTLLTGGWAAMASVQRARADVLPAVRVSTRDQDTAYGTARFATRLLPSASQAPAAPGDPDEAKPSSDMSRTK